MVVASAGVSATAFMALAFVPEEDSGVATEGDEGVTAEATAGAAGDAAGADGIVDDCAVLCAGTNDASESRKYHAPPATAAIKPAATPIQIPLPLPLRLLTSGPLSPKS